MGLTPEAARSPLDEWLEKWGYAEFDGHWRLHVPDTSASIAVAELRALLAREVETYKQAADEMAVELHAAIHEPMYAGTRADWIYRAQAAEAEVARLKGEVEQAFKDGFNCGNEDHELEYEEVGPYFKARQARWLASEAFKRLKG